MRQILFVFIVLFSGIFSANAGTIKEIFRAQKNHYVAIIKSADFEYIVTYDRDLEFKVFSLSGFSFYLFDGNENNGRGLDGTSVAREICDDSFFGTFYDMTGIPITRKRYVRDETDDAKKIAMIIDTLVEGEFEKYRTMDDPKTTADLRRIFMQLDIDLGFEMPFEDEPYPFPQFPFQIESMIVNAWPIANLATPIGITARFLNKESTWFESIEEAAMTLVEKISKHASVDDQNDERIFASYSQEMKYKGLDPRLKKAISKHLKYEVLEVRGMECEGSIGTWIRASWVLKDGSMVAYWPDEECD